MDEQGLPLLAALLAFPSASAQRCPLCVPEAVASSNSHALTIHHALTPSRRTCGVDQIAPCFALRKGDCRSDHLVLCSLCYQYTPFG